MSLSTKGSKFLVNLMDRRESQGGEGYVLGQVWGGGHSLGELFPGKYHVTIPESNVESQGGFLSSPPWRGFGSLEGRNIRFHS